MKTSPLLAFIHFLEKLGAWVLVCFATVALAAGLILASLVENRSASLVLATVASVTAGFIYALTIPRALAAYASESEVRFRDREEKLRVVLNQQRNLDAEISRYKSMHLNVDGYKPILKLSLLSVKSSIRDYLHTPIYSDRKYLDGGFLGMGKTEHAHKAELFNIIRADFDACLGVDLHKLRFNEYKPGKVRVVGFRQEFQGFQNLHQEKELTLRIDTTSVSETNEVVSQTISRDDGESIKKGDEMMKTLLERVNSGTEFSHLDQGVLRMTKAFLEVIFAPLNVTLEFDSSGVDMGLPFVEFLESKNNEIETKIKGLESQRIGLLKE